MKGPKMWLRALLLFLSSVINRLDVVARITREVITDYAKDNVK